MNVVVDERTRGDMDDIKKKKKKKKRKKNVGDKRCVR